MNIRYFIIAFLLAIIPMSFVLAQRGGAGSGTTPSGAAERAAQEATSSTTNQDTSQSQNFPLTNFDESAIAKAGGLSEFLANDESNVTIRRVWRTILNLTNVAIVVVLLGVAFATIFHLQVDTYGIKKVLPTLIVGVILANLSFLISRAIIDVSQVLAATFINAAGGKEALVQQVSDGIVRGGFDNLATFFTSTATGTVTASGLAIAGIFLTFSGFTAIILIGVLIIVGILILIPAILFAILAFLLYARTVILILLIVVSPAAFIAMAFAPTQGLFRQWWGQMLRWAFMSPIVFFFLWLATQFNEFSEAGTFAVYALALLMLYLAIQVPFKLGGAVMGVYGGVGRKVFQGGTKAAWSGTNAFLDRMGSTRLGRQLGIAGLTTAKEAVQERFTEQAARNKALAGGEVGARVEAVVGGGTFRFGRGAERYERQRGLAERRAARNIARERFMDAEGNSLLTEDNFQRIIQHGSREEVEAAMTTVMSERNRHQQNFLDENTINQVRTRHGTVYRDLEHRIAQIRPDLVFGDQQHVQQVRDAARGRVDPRTIGQQWQGMFARFNDDRAVSPEMQQFLTGLSDNVIRGMEEFGSEASRQFVHAARQGTFGAGLQTRFSQAFGNAPGGQARQATPRAPRNVAGNRAQTVVELQQAENIGQLFTNISANPQIMNNIQLGHLRDDLGSVNTDLRTDLSGLISTEFGANSQVQQRLVDALTELTTDPNAPGRDYYRDTAHFADEVARRAGLAAGTAQRLQLDNIVQRYQSDLNNMFHGYRQLRDLGNIRGTYGTGWNRTLRDIYSP